MMFHLYGLIVGIGIVAGWSVAEKIEPRVNRVLPYVLGFGIVGARLYHVVDQWGYYGQHLWQIIELWKGGLGIFGGVVGGIVGLVIYQQTNKLTRDQIWKILAASVTGLPIGQAIGRWGNLVNNELWGRNHEPLFLYESGLDLALFCLIWQIRRIRQIENRAIVGVYLVGYGLIRLILEPLKPNPWWLGYYVAGGFVIVGILLIGLTIYTPMGYAKKHGRSNPK